MVVLKFIVRLFTFNGNTGQVKVCMIHSAWHKVRLKICFVSFYQNMLIHRSTRQLSMWYNLKCTRNPRLPLNDCTTGDLRRIFILTGFPEEANWLGSNCMPLLPEGLFKQLSLGYRHGLNVLAARTQFMSWHLES